VLPYVPQWPIRSYDRVISGHSSTSANARWGSLNDPSSQTILVYPAGQQPQVFQNSEASLPIPDPIPPLNLSAAEIFSWLKHP